MAKWMMTFQDKICQGQFTPRTVEGPPYEPVTVSADSAEEAAQKAKDIYPTVRGAHPFGVTDDQMDVILVTSFDATTMTMDAGVFDFHTLERRTAPSMM